MFVPVLMFNIMSSYYLSDTKSKLHVHNKYEIRFTKFRRYFILLNEVPEFYY